MSIQEITTDQLRRMEGKEGLILQGCGGSLLDWQNGINNLLTEAGILKNGTQFETVYAFQHEGTTCLLFPFEGSVELDVGKFVETAIPFHLWGYLAFGLCCQSSGRISSGAGSKKAGLSLDRPGRQHFQPGGDCIQDPPGAWAFPTGQGDDTEGV